MHLVADLFELKVAITETLPRVALGAVCGSLVIRGAHFGNHSSGLYVETVGFLGWKIPHFLCLTYITEIHEHRYLLASGGGPEALLGWVHTCNVTAYRNTVS